jgi:hypothetical protein
VARSAAAWTGAQRGLPSAVRASMASTHEDVDHELAVLTMGAEGGIDVVGAEEWRAGQEWHVPVNGSSYWRR